MSSECQTLRLYCGLMGVIKWGFAWSVGYKWEDDRGVCKLRMKSRRSRALERSTKVDAAVDAAL